MGANLPARSSEVEDSWYGQCRARLCCITSL